jgi:peptide/nickel transport system substrate-binding protein
MLKKGDLDYMGVRPIQWVRQTVSEKFTGSFYRLEYYTPNYSYIAWNARNDLFADARVRQALTHLIDSDAILEKLLFGLGKRVAGTFYIYSRYYNNALTPREYDPHKAAALLRQAGWADSDNDGILDRRGKKFSFVFTISSGSKFAERLGTIMKEDFRKAGIDMEINRYEWAVFVQKLHKRDFDAVTLSWSLGYNEDPYDLWHSSQREAGFNFVGFNDAEADAIMEKGRREFDAQRRTAMFRRLEEILYREQPYTFLFCSPALVVVTKRFDNVTVHRAGLDVEEWTVREDR